MASTLPPIHINQVISFFIVPRLHSYRMLSLGMLTVIFYLQKVVKNNLFSKHDNRHAFQDSGVYFGQVIRSHPFTLVSMC